MGDLLQKIEFATKIIDLRTTLTFSQNKDLREHSLEVSQIARMILKSIDKEKSKIKIDERTQNILNFVDIDTLADLYELHDLGKVFIPEFILNKPSNLTSDEYRVVQHHPIFAERMLETILLQETKLSLSMRAFYDALFIICGEHHENYDGSGYPRGKKGEDISLLGRVARVADVISALMGNRCYDREITSFTSIATYLQEKSNILFDKEIVDITISKNTNELHQKFSNKKKKQLENIFNSKQFLDKIISSNFNLEKTN